MRTIIRRTALAIVLTAGTSWPVLAQSQDFVWASACKACHASHYAAWERTKHAMAINRLSAADKQQDCVGCHMTGMPPLAEKDLNANIQCEACHGAGRAHVEAAKAGTPKPGSITRKPAESTCARCHSEKSPHFKFFSYAAMSGLVHAGAK